MHRIAISKRLSRADDASTSFDVQERACRSSLDAAGLSGVVRVFEDYGVSGASPLASREGMSALRAWGPTHVIAWKIDRYARSMREFLSLAEWASDNGVTLMTADGTLNTGSAAGRLVATILVALAEWERDMVVARTTAGHAERRLQGRWSSGKPPWPYTVERRDGGSYLAEDPEAFTACRAAIDDLLSGGNATSTARGLPIRVSRWRDLLRGPVLLGYREWNGRMVTESDGVTPVRYGPEVIDAATHARVRARLADLAAGERVARPDSPWLSEMMWCRCGGRMYGGTTGRPRGSQLLYACSNGDASIRASAVHPEVERAFLAEHGASPLYHTTYVGGIDHSAEMAALDAQRERIVDAIATVGGPAVEALSARLVPLEARYEELAAAHDPVARAVRTPTGADLYDAWEGSTLSERRRLLLDSGLRVVVHPAGAVGGRLRITWE